MEIISVDPRDQTWEIDAPRYRGCFHDAAGGSDEYEISGADVPDVMEWAEAQSRGPMSCMPACPTLGSDSCASTATIRMNADSSR
jgi:hypothetical protein